MSRFAARAIKTNTRTTVILFIVFVLTSRCREISLARPDVKPGEVFGKTFGVDPNVDSSKLPILLPIRRAVANHVLASKFGFELLAGITADKGPASTKFCQRVQTIERDISAVAINADILLPKDFLDLGKRVAAVVFQAVGENQQR